MTDEFVTDAEEPAPGAGDSIEPMLENNAGEKTTQPRREFALSSTLRSASTSSRSPAGPAALTGWHSPCSSHVRRRRIAVQV